jgi:carboxypeptidase C (cathepsin A)
VAPAIISSRAARLRRAWRPWTKADRSGEPAVLGYVTEYAHNFSYATIKGAGHMAPTFRPAAALEMLTRFLTRRSLRD